MSACQQAAVGVSIEGHTQCGATLLGGTCHSFGMKRPAIQVDIAPIGFHVDQQHLACFSAEPPHQLWRNRGGCAVGAIGNHAKSGQRQSRHAIEQKPNVIVEEIWIIFYKGQLFWVKLTLRGMVG